MRITGVEAIALRIPVSVSHPPLAFGTMFTNSVDVLLVRIDTDEGVSGFGEAFGYDAVPTTKVALDTLVTPLLLGQDPRSIRSLVSEVQRALQYYFHGVRRVREATGATVAAGENASTAWEFRAMFEARVNLAQPSVTKVGGITEFAKIVELAELHNVGLAPHSPVYGPGFLAALQLAVAFDIPTPIEYSIRGLEGRLHGAAVQPANGQIRVPQDHGLGPDPDPEVIRRYRTM